MRMFKVHNRKVIRRLAVRSYQAARTRNTIATFAVFLTAVLFTALFTIGSGLVDTVQRQTMRQYGGDYHGILKYLTRQQYETLSKDPLIRECADAMLVADQIKNQAFGKRHLEAWYYPAHYYPHCLFELVDGKNPEAADEILLDEESLRLLGKEPVAGQQVTLAMMVKERTGKVEERTFTVSGVLRADPVLNTGFAIVSKTYVDAHAGELVDTFREDFSLTGTIRMNIIFHDRRDIQGKLYQVILNGGYSVDVNDPDYIDNNVNRAWLWDGLDIQTTAGMAGILLLILLTGYLIIYNIFQISVIRDIRYYGLLKTVGATGRQIRQIVRRQALRCGFLGAVPGLAGGFVLGRLTVPWFVSVSSLHTDEIIVLARPAVFCGAFAFTLLTVWISAGRPARIAAKVSPVEAVRYTEGSRRQEIFTGRRCKALWRGRRQSNRTQPVLAGGSAIYPRSRKYRTKNASGRLWRMALAAFGRNKSKSLLVVLSLSMSVILFNSVLTITRSFQLDVYLKHYVTTDFLIGNARYFNLSDPYSGLHEKQVLDEKLSESMIEACEAQEGFVEGGRLYASGSPGLKKSSWMVPQSYGRSENGSPGWYTGGSFRPLEERENGTYPIYFYGMEDFFYKHLEILEGETDTEVIKEKLKSGKYLVFNVATDDGRVLMDQIRHKPGDKIVLIFANGQEQEFEILSMAAQNTNCLTNRSGWTGNFCYYTDAEIFKQLLSDRFLMSYGFSVDDEKEDQMEQFLEYYTTTQEPLMNYESGKTWTDSYEGLQNLVLRVGGLLAAVTGMTGLLNFINAILTSMAARQREFATLEAVGMTRTQLLHLLMMEGACYALATELCALCLGSLLSLTILRTVINGMWFLSWQFYILPVILAAPVMFAACAAIPAAAFYCGKQKSVTERLREDG